MQEYHDNEWGTPVHDDPKLFEFLILEGAQAGLSWSTVLNKRENYRDSFDNSDFVKIAKYGKKKVVELMQNSGIIRNRLKIQAAITNAQKFIEVQKEFGSFDKYVWSFVNGRQLKNNFKSLKEFPVKNELSDKTTHIFSYNSWFYLPHPACSNVFSYFIKAW